MLPLSLQARKGAAISWYCVRIRTMYQEIATGFALAMTWFSDMSFCFDWLIIVVGRRSHDSARACQKSPNFES